MAENYRIRSREDVVALERLLLSTYLRIPIMPVLKGVLTDLEKLHDNYFEADVGPGGHRWPDLAPSTIARKGHDDILEESLKMREAVTRSSAAGAIRDAFEESSFAGVVFGLDDGEIEYWKYHDQRGGRLPWRPFIGITEAEVNVIGQRLIDHKVEEMVKHA